MKATFFKQRSATHGGTQVAGANEEGIHSIHLGNGLELDLQWQLLIW